MEHWNTHRIRRSKYQTVTRRPDALYFLPERQGSRDYKQESSSHKFEHVSQHFVTEFGVLKPNNWREAMAMYEKLINVSGDT